MNKHLFYIVFVAVVGRSMLFTLTWPDVVLLIALLLHFGYKEFIELSKNKEDIKVLENKLLSNKTQLESQIDKLNQQVIEVKNKVNFATKR